MEAASPVFVTESPPLRTTILGSFLRGRPRGTSTSQQAPPQQQDLNRDLTPSPPAQVQAPASQTHRRRSAAPGALGVPPTAPQNQQSPPAPSSGPSLGISNILRRRRSAGNVASNNTSNPHSAVPTPAPPPLTAAAMTLPVPPPVNRGASGSSANSSYHRIRLVPHLDSRRTLRFEPITRDLKDGDLPLRIGRFTDRSGIGLAAANALSSNKLAFKSKVVSRAHAEIWSESTKFFIKDTKSSSGTFLNHVRLSPAGQESKPHQLKDGDILQLGVDYQGGAEDIYKSVKIRIEIGREWQAAANAFNTNALSQLRSLAVNNSAENVGTAAGKKRAPPTNIQDCCICLFSVTIRQALFIAPCSHAFHYKCIRPLLEAHASAFSCPLCRTFADLEEDVEIEAEVEEEDEGDLVPPASAPPSTTSHVTKLLAVPPPMTRDGAETEVETDAPRSSRRPRMVIRTEGHIPQMNPVGDFDEEMLDGDVDDEDEDGGDGSMSPGIVVRGAGFGLPLVHGVGEAAHDSSEGEGSGSGEMEIERGIEGETVSGKRKR
ncbi:SMAD/FHA domain-containing protein [Leucogyrophana mollusca]|uniref:SMAD/FHA domain-containing protein n=1 Tax=Leucogyrophana mollusca TaxID=85980 RepID=A0ACB8BUN5_9AGAM|nr:SMAD/FHA domain-containing protein [Leucogyrophana mollusca]